MHVPRIFRRRARGASGSRTVRHAVRSGGSDGESPSVPGFLRRTFLRRFPWVLILSALVLAAAVATVLIYTLPGRESEQTIGEQAAAPPSTQPPLRTFTTTSEPAVIQPPATTQPPTTTTTTTTVSWWYDPALFGKAPETETVGILGFRGSPSRSWYGTGPIPETVPVRLWRFPANEDMCSSSSYQGEQVRWCGTGWTGQPAVFEHAEKTWVVFGGFDGHVHFLDAETGERLLPDFETADLIKTSVTIDPDGFPLAYFGSRDNNFRIVAFDREEPTELWSLNAYDVPRILWNDDWDSSPLVIDDHLFLAGENSWFFVYRLNRSYGLEGVTVSPELIVMMESWDEELLEDLTPSDGNRYNTAIEASPTISGDTLYIVNSGGLLTGWDISVLRDEDPPSELPRIFRFWAGDDVDATPVADSEGFVYLGVEHEDRNTERAEEVGQLVKLDPSNPTDPIVWSVFDDDYVPSGVWGTPAVWRDVVFAGTHTGRFFALDRDTGEIRWEKGFPDLIWSSPVVIGERLLLADGGGYLRAYDVSDTTVEPPELWNLKLSWRFESTPAVWDGVIYVGGRAGAMMAVGKP